MQAHENPFRTQQILKLRYRPQEDSWDSLLERFDSLGRRVCLLGHEGAGKTTLLEDLCQPLIERGYRPHLRLHGGQAPRPDWSELYRLGKQDVLLLDGADLLNGWQWWMVHAMSRRWGGLVAASHDRPLLPVLLTCRTSVPLLQELLSQVLPQARSLQIPALAEELFAKHKGNLREALRECYDRWAAL